METSEQLHERIRILQEDNEALRAAVLAERGHSLQALAQSEQRYRNLFDTIDEGFCIIEFLDGPHGPLSDYVHIEANVAYARHTGIQGVVGKKVREMVPGEAAGWVDLYRDVLVTGKPIRFERELVATRRYLELAAFRVEPPGSRQVAVLFQDITARKRAEAALRQLNETLEIRVSEALAERKVLADIFERTNAFVQVLDANFQWIAINAAAAREFERLFGIWPKAGDNFMQLIDGKGVDTAHLRSLWSRAFAGEEFVEVVSVLAPGGDTRHYELHFSLLHNADGESLGAYQFAYDVTDRLKEQEKLHVAEEALRQSQKMEAVGQLTGGIAHDFNNMLAVVSSSLRLTQKKLSRGDVAVEDLLASGIKGAERAANLVSRLMSFSRQQALAPQEINLNQLVGGMEDVLRRTIPEDVRIEFVQSGGLWPLHADPHGLESALLNLAVNARDAMNEGGRLTIETANVYLDDAYAAANGGLQPGQYVLVAVTDSGHGMSAETVARAFDPFFTTKPVGSGTGLGLSQVYGFLRQSGGHVKIYSELGLGTTVKLYFPRSKEASHRKAAPAQVQDLPSGKGQAVLVVEDDDDVRKMTVSNLVELGYRAIPASGAQEALDLLSRHDDVALLLTDVVMPGMNGRKLADKAWQMRPSLKVLFTTGYARNALVHNGALEEGLELLMKPYSLEGLATKVARLLATRAQS